MPVKYIGSKRRLLPLVLRAVEALAPGGTVLDLFSGTSRVGRALKARGYRVLANDHTAFAEAFARCYVAADREEHEVEASRRLRELALLPGRAGWFTETYAQQSRYLQPKNAARIEAIREAIRDEAPDPEREAVLLTALVEAADRVDSTVGVQMAYLKDWSPRSHRDLDLRLPDLAPRAASGKGEAHRMEAAEAAARLDADVAYLDPPYNGHSYLGNYHVWESLVLWDRPEVYGLARKRADCRIRRSPFNRRASVRAAFQEVVAGLRTSRIVVSFNDEGFLSREDVEAVLRTRGEVAVLSQAQRRYVGAAIGIYNPAGERVGEPGPTQNVEHVFVVSPDGVPPGLVPG